MSRGRAAIAAILDAARRRGDGGLLETEGLALLEAMGIAVPRTVVVPDADAVERALDPRFPGERVVVKVVAAEIAHKTDVGGVAVVPNTPEEVRGAIATMERRFAGRDVDGYAVQAFVPHEGHFGHELLVSLRWTHDFGPVVTVGAGGVSTEVMAAALRRDEALAIVSPAFAAGGGVERALERVAAVRQITASHRGRTPVLPLARLSDLVRRLVDFAAVFVPDPVGELEVNPLVLADGGLVALDALVRFTRELPRPVPPRPLARLGRLLEPRSIALMGVSEKLNPGRIILRNLLAAGTPPERVTVIKPECDAIDGCRCVPAIGALPQRVDLLVLSIAAARVPEAIAAVVDGARAESVILIPGGLDETPTGRALAAQVRERIAESRATAWGGPVINGGNCLGVRSAPGRLNTLFIPDGKLPAPAGAPDPVAFLSGSGAFTVSRLSKLGALNPRYVVSVGNQMDLTLADYLEHLEGDPAVDLFAVYAEGFRPLDGLRFMQAARRITAAGRSVVLYAGGRTRAGASAAASHTAAMAGDHETLRQLARAAGVVLADSLETFDDLVRLLTLLREREVAGLELGAITNAGFECVAIADHLGAFRLPVFAPGTTHAVEAALERARLGGIVAPRNPIDLTPIMGDADYEAVVRAVLLDPGVQAGLIGCVPMTGALNTLAAGPGHGDDITRDDSIASRLVRLRDLTRKPWVVVVDGGRLYDAMAARIEDGGIPVFRAADRALAVFNAYAAEMLRRRAAREARPSASRRPARAQLEVRETVPGATP